MSINQMCVYRTILEAQNIMKNDSSEKLKMKWTDKHKTNHFLRKRTKTEPKLNLN